jgi:hemerythrin superfamily protein
MADQQFTDAIMLLRNDHREVEDLFEQFENASGDGRKQKLAEQICNELKIHAMIEEEIFYPAFAGKIDEDDLKEAYVEHDAAKLMINDIMSSSEAGDEFYDAKVKVLSEEIKHHIEEEEAPNEGMFAQCRETDVDIKALLEPMAARKAELKAQAESGGLPPAQTTAVHETTA